jgi:hypothetical protein
MTKNIYSLSLAPRKAGHLRGSNNFHGIRKSPTTNKIPASDYPNEIGPASYHDAAIQEDLRQKINKSGQ